MIQISAQRFNNELRSAQNLGYLLACIGEKIIVETDFYFEDITYSTADNVIKIEPPAADVDLTDVSGVIWSEDGVAFTDYLVGDTIGVEEPPANWNYYTVTEKFDNGMIRTNYGGGPLTLAIGSNVFNATPFAGVRYAFNLIDTGQSYNSLIDGEFQQAEIATALCTNTAYQDMAFKGILSYQIGLVQIKGIAGSGGGGGGDSQQSFTIKHTTYVTPLFLMQQWEDLILNIPPSYFLNQECLHYVSQIQLGRTLSNPNNFQTVDLPYQLSNIGWFNEKFNGSKTNYSISLFEIKIGGVGVDALQFGVDNSVEITIGNTTDSPFSSGNTKYIFGFNYLPEEESFYQDNGENQTTNFVFDSKLNTLGSGSANGANFGTAMQVIKTVTSTFISSSSAKITAVINVGADAEDIIKQGDYRRYQMWVIVENHALAASLSDKVNLLAQVSEFEEILTTTDLIDASSLFIRHPFTNVDTAHLETTNFDMFPVDDVAVQTDFSIDFTNHLTEAIKILRINVSLELELTGYDNIVLDNFALNTSAFPLVGGLVQEIDFSQDRIFKIPAGEIRKTITIKRVPSLDSGNTYFWRINYPFMNRWEYWEALAIAIPPTTIFDPTEPLNGLNHFWNRLVNSGAGIDFFYRVVFEIEQNGQEFEQEFEVQMFSSDFESGTEWGNESIKSYNPALVELTSGGNKYLEGFEDVKIIASFEKISGLIPDVDNVEIVIWIETFESGGIGDIRRISSVYEIDSQSWFKSVDTSNKVKIVKTGAVFTGEVYVDYTKLPTNSKFTIYARIYDLTGGCEVDALLYEDGTCMDYENSTNILEE